MTTPMTRATATAAASAFAATLLLTAGTANAGMLHYDFAGHFSGSDMDLPSGAVVMDGANFTGRISYDNALTVTPTSSTRATAINYGFFTINIESSVGMLSFTTDASSRTVASVYNNDDNWGDSTLFNVIDAGHDATATGLTNQVNTQLAFYSRSNDVRDVLSMPVDLNPSDYGGQMTIVTQEGFFVTGVFTSITQVPAPTALAAFAGLGLITPRRRR